MSNGSEVPNTVGVVGHISAIFFNVPHGLLTGIGPGIIILQTKGFLALESRAFSLVSVIAIRVSGLCRF